MKYEKPELNRVADAVISIQMTSKEAPLHDGIATTVNAYEADE
jgi:hypothetical protein